MLTRKLRPLSMIIGLSGLLMASSCQLIVDPTAVVGVANALSRCDFEFDDGELEDIECGDHHNDDYYYWSPWWWF